MGSRAWLKTKMMRSGVKEECSICGLGPIWNGSKLSLELDHIDGDNRNDIGDNLRLLCPNCHAQQPTTNRKKNKSKKLVIKITPDVIVQLARRGLNIRQILIEIKCSDTGANYKKARKILLDAGMEIRNKLKIDFAFDGRTIGGPRPHLRKVGWPAKGVLGDLIEKYSCLELGRMFGVSGNAVAKWCRIYGIKTKPVGFWAKAHSLSRTGLLS